VIRVVLVGLTEGSLRSPQRQRRAIDGVMSLMRGELVRPTEGPGADLVERPDP
jgi:hypothetical protein